MKKLCGWGVGLLLLSVSAAAGERILVIGDSHSVGSFGRRLDDLLRERTPEVATYGSCGSSPSWWFDGRATQCGYFHRGLNGRSRRGTEAATPLLSTLLSEIEPDTIVVALGANLVNAPRDWAERTTRQMVELIAGKPGLRCVWVGPPHGRNKPEPGFGEFYTLLEGIVKPTCEFIDSRPFAQYPETGGDGVHFDHLGRPGVAIAEKWAESVFGLMY
jgi:lysophospholipase L1-like esterase